MDRAKCIPSTAAQRQSEKRRVINDLKANDYPESFIKSVDEPNRIHVIDKRLSGAKCKP